MYNAEDYIQSLKKYSRRASGSSTVKSIYDTSDTAESGSAGAANGTAAATAASSRDDKRSSSTLPSKHSDYK